jgi:hypothetical protein
MTQNFRHIAREALKRAKVELASNSPERVLYAALELRLAMEAVTYDRALAFKAEIPPEEYKTWQPRKLMQVLHDIDPTIGLSSTLAFGLQDDPQTPAPPERMQLMGMDTVFTLQDLKTHYDAIGSYLHMPSLEQVQKGNVPDPAKLRERCEAVVTLLDAVLISPVWNSTFGQFAQLDECMRCHKPVHKRVPHGKAEIEATCFECKAAYTITDGENGQVFWKPVTQEIPCQTPGCTEKVTLWRDEICVGTNWKCPGCNQHWMIQLAIGKVPPSS